jgi:hypothetical protein
MSPGARPTAFACALSIRGSDARGRLLSLDRTIEDPMREDTPAAVRTHRRFLEAGPQT